MCGKYKYRITIIIFVNGRRNFEYSTILPQLNKPNVMALQHDVCRLCLSNDRLQLHRLSSVDWTSSEVGKLYQEVTGNELVELTEGLAAGYCDACLARLRHASESLRIFRDTELFWSDLIRTNAEDGTSESTKPDLGEDDACRENIFEVRSNSDEMDVVEAQSYECFECHMVFSDL